MKKIITSSKAQELAYSLIAIILVVMICYQLQSVIVPFVFAGLISFLLLPFCDFLEKYKFPRILAIIISILLVVVVLFGLFYFIISQIMGLQELMPVVQQKTILWIQSIENTSKKYVDIDQSKILEESEKYLSEILKNSSKFVSNIIGTTSGFLVNLSLLPLYIFLFLLYRDFLKTFLYKLLKDSPQIKIDITIDKIIDVVGNYINGLGKVIFLIGILNTLALFLLGIDHAIFFGFFAAILILIPYIGILIGALLPIMVALITKDSYVPAIGVAISFYVIQFLEGNFITPYVVGNKVSINSLVAIASLLLFSSLWGLSGLVLALPLTAVLKVIFDASDSTKAWGFLLGDADHIDVKR